MLALLYFDVQDEPLARTSEKVEKRIERNIVSLEFGYLRGGIEEMHIVTWLT